MNGQGKYRRISQQQKEAIYFMARTGKSYSEIGCYYGLDRDRVQRIVREMESLQVRGYQ